MARVPIALQLYSVREDCARDFPGTVKAVADMGYQGVEFAGYYDRTAAQIRQMLDDNGLKAAGTHIGIDTLLGDQLQKSVEFNLEIGNKFLIVPGFPEQYRDSADAWKRTAELMNGISDKLAPHGLRTGYHNHAVEFQPIDGQLPWDIFFGNTKKEVVMQFDTGNAMHGGASPLPWLEKFPGRATTVHLKEFFKEGNIGVIGDGEIPWQEVFALCESSHGTEWYIVEQEVYGMPPLETSRKCLAALRTMGK